MMLHSDEDEFDITMESKLHADPKVVEQADSIFEKSFEETSKKVTDHLDQDVKKKIHPLAIA